ncbi:unnamed protein product [Effrenium voratum]|nr:unnamed protein product [Effrenium voratum]
MMDITKLGVRGVGESECCHPSWNSFRKAIGKAGLTCAMMKLVLCNFDHGAWKSGDRLEAKKESFDDYLRNQPREYFSLFSERVAHDRMESYDAEVDPGETLAKTKAWFGILACLRDLSFDWTIQEEALHALKLMLERHSGSPEPDEEHDEEEQQEELLKMYNKDGPTSMVAGFMADRSLQSIARMLFVIAQPMEQAYYDTLSRLQEGWPGQADWASKRAMGSWWTTVWRILQTLQTPELHDRLCMMMSLGKQLPPDELPEWAKPEHHLLLKAFAFATALAENVFWSNAQFWLSIPALIASLLSRNRAFKRRALQQMRRLVCAVEALEQHQQRNPHNKELEALLADLGWQQQQMARECMALLLQGDFQETLPLM